MNKMKKLIITVHDEILNDPTLGTFFQGICDLATSVTVVKSASDPYESSDEFGE